MASWLVVNKQDEKYLIQVSWPLEWESTEDQPIVNKANAVKVRVPLRMYHQPTLFNLSIDISWMAMQ